MTPRFVLMFVVIYCAVILAEWYRFLSGFDYSRWAAKDWMTMVFVLVAEAVAIAIISFAVDKALPAMGNRAVPSSRSRHQRRGSQRYRAR